MDITSVNVEVRNSAYERVLSISPLDLELTVEWAHNRAGEWTVVLPAGSDAATRLREPGAGIVVSLAGEEVFSGFTVRPSVFYGPDRYAGQATIKGVGDGQILEDRLAFPQPSNPDPATQSTSTDTRTNYAESLMHDFVRANIGPLSPEARRIDALAMGENGGRGKYVTVNARFHTLRRILDTAARGSGLGYRVIQRDEQIVFETYKVEDKTGAIRLSVSGGTLSSNQVAYSAPEVTRAIVGGKGSKSKRIFRGFYTDDSLEAESDWNRRIEVYYDQQGISSASELENAAMQNLETKGFTSVTGRAVPLEAVDATYLQDWAVGDRVSVVFEDQEFRAIVEGAVLRIEDGEVGFGVTLGNPIGFDPTARLYERQRTASAALHHASVMGEVPYESIETLEGSVETTITENGRRVQARGSWSFGESLTSEAGASLGLYGDDAINIEAGSRIRSNTIRDTTVSESANVFVSPNNGNLARVTSSRRYKTAIEDEDFGRAILDAQPASWIDKASVDAWLEGEEAMPRRHFGFIAEQLVDAGLGAFVAFDEHGRPDSVAYDRLTAAVVPMLRDLHDRTVDLEDRLALAETAIESLASTQDAEAA